MPTALILIERDTLMMSDEMIVMAGFILIMLGVLLIFVGFLHMTFSHAPKGQGKVETGGVIMIGPIPIAFGTSSRALFYSMILAVILIVISIILVWYSKNLVVYPK